MTKISFVAAALPLLVTACAHRDAGPVTPPPAEASAEIPLEPLVIDHAESLAEVSPFYDWRLDAHRSTKTLDDASESARTARTEPLVAPTLDAACDWPRPEFYFDHDSATLTRAAKEDVAALATCLMSDPLADDPITVTGHTDPIGSDEYNRELGLRRAEAVARALADQGVDRERIETYSRGEWMAEDSSANAMSEDDRRAIVRLDS